MKTIINKQTSVSYYKGENLLLTPSGASNGEWFDKDCTTANCELVTCQDVPADWAGGHYTYAGNQWARTAEGAAAHQALLAAAIAATVQKIDADTDALYAAVTGNRGMEYITAEAEATAFAGGGYTADPAPASVASWATAKGWTAQAAADDIIATATAWRAAQAAIRAARLLRKERARTAADLAALATTRAQWAGFVAAIREQLGV